MAFVRITDSGYCSPCQMRNLINYVLSESKHQLDGLIGGSGILATSVDDVYSQMMEIKKRYKKTDQYMLRHIIVSPADDEYVFWNRTAVYCIGRQICALFPGYQTVFSVNLETGRPHLHIAINTVSFIDGTKLQLMHATRLNTEVNKIVASYMQSYSPMENNTLHSLTN